MAWSEPGMTGSELLRYERRGKSQTRGSTHLSDGSGVLYYTIRNGGDELLPQEPSEMDESLRERLWSDGHLVKLIFRSTPSYSASR